MYERDTYLGKEHPEFDPDDLRCAKCGALIERGGPITTNRDHIAWMRYGVCASCWKPYHDRDSRYTAKPCPFPWIGNRCSLNEYDLIEDPDTGTWVEKAICRGSVIINPTRKAWAGLKWWLTDYDRCLRDYQAIAGEEAGA